MDHDIQDIDTPHGSIYKYRENRPRCQLKNDDGRALTSITAIKHGQNIGRGRLALTFTDLIPGHKRFQIVQDTTNLLRQFMNGKRFLDKPFTTQGEEFYDLLIDAVTARQ